jgi:hypothetical protein
MHHVNNTSQARVIVMTLIDCLHASRSSSVARTPPRSVCMYQSRCGETISNIFNKHDVSALLRIMLIKNIIDARRLGLLVTVASSLLSADRIVRCRLGSMPASGLSTDSRLNSPSHRKLALFAQTANLFPESHPLKGLKLHISSMPKNRSSRKLPTRFLNIIRNARFPECRFQRHTRLQLRLAPRPNRLQLAV